VLKPTNRNDNLAKRNGWGSREVLPLTGLRFLAALFVVLGHSINSLLTFNPPVQNLLIAFQILTAIGMSLFFVLSGFVIHYNYYGSIREGKEATARFFVARSARLIPLYFLFLSSELGISWSASAFPSAYYYFALAQSWVYIQYDGRSLLSHMIYAPVTWSISTEWFFYCLYPLVAILVSRRGIISLVGATLVYMSILSLGYLNTHFIDDFGLRVWGPTAVDRSDGNTLFYAWVFNFSPLGRLHEFFTGVIAAHLFVTLSNRGHTSRIEPILGAMVLTGALAVLFAVQVALTSSAMAQYYQYIAAASMFLVPITVGTIILSLGHYPSIPATLLSSAPLVAAGEASYSIYLFHTPALQMVSFGKLIPLNAFFGMIVASRYLVFLILLILFCVGMYKAYESGMRSFIRKRLDVRRSGIAKVVIALSIGVPTVTALCGWCISFGLLR